MAPTLQSTDNTLPFLASSVPWGDKMRSSDPLCPFQSSHCSHPKLPAHQALEQNIFSPILGFKQDSHSCLQPAMSQRHLMHSHGTSPQHLYCFSPFWARGCSSDFCSSWPDLSLSWEWTEVMKWPERWHSVASLLYCGRSTHYGQTNKMFFSLVSHSVLFQFNIHHGNRKNLHLGPG